MKLQFLAIPLLLALVFSPLVAAAANGSITFSSPTAGTALSGVASYTVSGTITPTPNLPDNVNIQVTEQGSSQVLDAANVAVGAGGTFTYSTNAGGNSAWTTGTYVISASDSNGATGTTTFTYKASPTGTTPTGSGVTSIDIFVAAATPVYSGQTVNIEAMLVWAANGTLVTATNTTITATLLPPTGASSSLGTPAASSTRGQYYWTTTLPANASDGAYFIQVVARHGLSGVNNFGWGLGSFTVNSKLASTTGVTTGVTSAVTSALTPITTSLASLTTSVAGLTSSLTAITSTLNTVSTNINAINSAVSGLSTTLGTVNTNVASLGTAISTLSSTVNTISTSVSSLSSGIQTLTSDVQGVQTTVTNLAGLSSQMTSLQSSVTSLNSSVSNSQTYILVVAALAVITLVLELAILIRKMS